MNCIFQWTYCLKYTPHKRHCLSEINQTVRNNYTFTFSHQHSLIRELCLLCGPFLILGTSSWASSSSPSRFHVACSVCCVFRITRCVFRVSSYALRISVSSRRSMIVTISHNLNVTISARLWQMSQSQDCETLSQSQLRLWLEIVMITFEFDVELGKSRNKQDRKALAEKRKRRIRK